MDAQPDTSFMARALGQNWRTTIGGTISAAGGVLATQTTGKWQIAGAILLAVGLQWMGASSRDKGVTSAQMDAAGDAAPIPTIKPPVALLAVLLCGLMTGCLAPVTVNVLSSRMVIQATGTNAATQSVEGGAVISSNNASATLPIR